MIEFVFTLLGELLLQLFAEILVDLGLRARTRPQRPRSAPLVGLGHCALGAALGGLSLLVLPGLLIPEGWRIANLFASPLLAGLAMAGIGHLRQRRGGERAALERFGAGYGFALGFALVRFAFAG